MTSKSSAASLTGKPLKDLTVVELKTLCKERGIKGVFHKSKAKILEMIEAASGTPDASAADPSSQSKPSKSGLTPKPEAKTSQDNQDQDSPQQQDLASLTIAQLKQLCKDQGIKGFARKNKQQLLELINPAVLQEPSHTDAKDSVVDAPDSDQLYSEDLNANQVDQEEPAEELPNEDLSSAELDAVKDNFESQFEMDTEDTMIEVSDSLILEVLDRFDRIEALLQHIAKNVGKS